MRYYSFFSPLLLFHLKLLHSMLTGEGRYSSKKTDTMTKTLRTHRSFRTILLYDE